MKPHHEPTVFHYDTTIMSSLHHSLLSDSEREYILAGCRVDCRLDGRACHEFRNYHIVVGEHQEANNGSLFPLCHGSARLAGSTGHAAHETMELLCTVKAELVHPSAASKQQQQQQQHSNGIVVELHVQGSAGTGGSMMEQRREWEQLEQILSQLLVSRLWTTSPDGDQEQQQQACYVGPDHVWRLAVDVFILEASGGSLLDAAARVVGAALQSTRLPRVVWNASDNDSKDAKGQTQDTLVVDSDWNKSVAVPLANPLVCIVTVAVLVDYDPGTQRPCYSLVVDASRQEESCAARLVHVCLVGPQIAALQMSGGTGALPLTVLPEITKLAQSVGSSAQKAYIRVARRSQQEFFSASRKEHEHVSSRILQETFDWQATE